MADSNNSKWSGANPWLGLGSYSEGQPLYGRDRETAALTALIQNNMAIVVYGKSGIGKSSLLKAGVFPMLRDSGMVPVYLRLVHNTSVSYVEQIAQAVARQVSLQDRLPSDVPDLGLWDFLHRHRFTNAEGTGVTPVVVLDQFEEIFTLTDLEHKAQVQALFTELADVLNDVKPDRVLQMERQRAEHEPPIAADGAGAAVAGGFVLQSLPKSELRYERQPSFRLVVSLRDDSLFLLERNSSRIPAFKVNRYNLQPLNEDGAMDVITRPRPGLFTDEEARRILDGIAYYEYDDYRVVDPAIISLFLYSYYQQQGRISYHHIFERYYQECLHNVSPKTVAYIESQLLTEGGYRTQLPYDALRQGGVSDAELQHLLQSMILKKERRGQTDYYEFSHDLLCKEALRHKNQLQTQRSQRRLRRLTACFAAILVGVGLGVWLLWPKAPVELVHLKLSFAQRGDFAPKEAWNAKFRFMALDRDSVLQLPVQTPTGTPVDVMEIVSQHANEFEVVVPADFADKHPKLRLQIFDPTDNCRPRTDTIDVARWIAHTPQTAFVDKKENVIVFTGRVVTTLGIPIERAMVTLGSERPTYTDADGRFSLYLEDSLTLQRSELYVFKQNYETAHLFGTFIHLCGRGSAASPLLVPLRAGTEQDDDADFEKLFAEQLKSRVTLYDLAQIGVRNLSKLPPRDSARLDTVMKFTPRFAMNLKKMRRTRKLTPDKRLDVYCVSLEEPQTDGIRSAIGYFQYDGQDYLFEGTMMRLIADNTQWRLSAVAWNNKNERYVLMGVLEGRLQGNEQSFRLEEMRPYADGQ